MWLGYGGFDSVWLGQIGLRQARSRRFSCTGSIVTGSVDMEPFDTMALSQAKPRLLQHYRVNNAIPLVIV